MSTYFGVAKCEFGVYVKKEGDKLFNRELKKGSLKFVKSKNKINF